MFDWKIKDEIIAANAIILGEKTEEKGRPFKARFLQAGLVKYNFGVCLLKKETIDKFINTFMQCPVIVGHKDNIKMEDVVGHIENIWFSPEDGWFWCSGHVDEETAKKVDNGYNVSCQYRITEYTNNDDNKLHNGNPYDKEILNGIFEHLAVVKNPRYEDAYIAVNAIMATNEDQWITIKPNGEENKGRHLLIKDGETPGDAIRRVYGDKNQKQLFDTSEYKKTKEDYKQEKEDKQKEFDKGIEARKEDESNHKFFTKDRLRTEEDKEESKQEEKKEPETEAVYTNLLNDKRLMDHLRESIKAQKADNPDAKVGDTQIDSDRFISLYTDKLSTKEYNSFDWDKAEDMVFKKLEEMEKEAGFKDGKENKQETNKEPETVEDKMKFYEKKMPKNYRYNTRSKAIWLYRNNLITMKEYENVLKASNSFIEQFKDMLYETVAEGIYNRLGE